MTAGAVTVGTRVHTDQGVGTVIRFLDRRSFRTTWNRHRHTARMIVIALDTGGTIIRTHHDLETAP